MLQLFIEIKLKFTKLETEAVARVAAAAVAAAAATLKVRLLSYLVVGTVIESHFDHKIAHVVNPCV